MAGKFEPGHKKVGGAKVGSIQQRSKTFREVMEKHNFCAATALIEIYLEAKKTYDNYAVIYEAISDARDKQGLDARPVEDKQDKYLKIAGDMAKELASYAYPKLKAIEHKKENPTDGMTPEQKLEFLKVMENKLKLEVKSGS